MFENIPNEMKQFNSWLLWKYEQHDEPKPRKVPYQITGDKAKSTDPRTWTTFAKVVELYNKGFYDGIGFVLSEADPYSIIDLDDTEGDEVELDRQKKIFTSFDSYSEYSPSLKGLHIIVRGKLPPGRRRRANIEVYTTGRFMTMTGNVFHQSPINSRQELLNILVEELGRGAPVADFGKDMPSVFTDEEIYNKALNAVNGEKFKLLWTGDCQSLYSSQSEADQALINILVFYTQNYAQIERLFHYSALGKREKAFRKSYLFGRTVGGILIIRGMVQKAFDKMVPPIDLDSLRNSIDFAMAQPVDSFVEQTIAIPAELGPLPTVTSPYTVPPGLIGEIANFIYSQAPLPVPEIALAGAIGFMAGLCGRAYNISGTGLNQYMLLIAKTGRGKEAIAQGIDAIMQNVKKTVPSSMEFIGPSEIASPQALNKFLTRSKCFVSLQGEFGLRLGEMSAEHAPAHMVGLRRSYLDLFNKSGQGRQLGQGIWADSTKNTVSVNAPSVSILGESTPENFYSVLSEKMISEGLLPRFTMIEYKGPVVEFNEHAKNVKPDTRLIEHVATLCTQCLVLNQQNTAQQVDISEDAAKLLKDFRKGCAFEQNKGSDKISNELWSRAHIKAMKLAALVAVGVNLFTPCITLDVARWSINLIVTDVQNMLIRFEDGEVGEDADESKQTEILKKIFVDYVRTPFESLSKSVQNNTTQPMHFNRIMPYRLISQKTASLAAFRNDKFKQAGALQKTLKTLIDSGDICEVNSPAEKQKYGSTTARLFIVANVKLLN